MTTEGIQIEEKKNMAGGERGGSIQTDACSYAENDVDSHWNPLCVHVPVGPSQPQQKEEGRKRGRKRKSRSSREREQKCIDRQYFRRDLRLQNECNNKSEHPCKERDASFDMAGAVNDQQLAQQPLRQGQGQGMGQGPTKTKTKAAQSP